jgi:glutamine synthetase
LTAKSPFLNFAARLSSSPLRKPPTLADLPLWGFDGSSTMQAEGKSSDCVLKPVALYPDASRKDAYIVSAK